MIQINDHKVFLLPQYFYIQNNNKHLTVIYCSIKTFNLAFNHKLIT